MQPRHRMAIAQPDHLKRHSRAIRDNLNLARQDVRHAIANGAAKLFQLRAIDP
jgi:hypothetical protein